jgi:NAD(P)-dependent dehydrogenase (short-subunit alcohol dehydrogenase family)
MSANTLHDRMAVVTGAGSGIGRAVALALAARGAAVAAVDLDVASAQETAALIASAGGRAEPFQCDTSKGVEIDRALTVAIRTLGPLEIMVNNAGILDGYFNVDETDEAVWSRVIGINLTGVFLGCKRALQEMLPRETGRIINMASVAGLNGTGGGAAYVASKHGVVGLTRQMAVTYSARGITINAVAPGPILTGLRAHSQEILGPGVPDMSGRGVAVSDEQVRAIAPAGRRGTVEEIASAVCFLASDGAGYITGHTLVVDGGWRAK